MQKPTRNPNLPNPVIPSNTDSNCYQRPRTFTPKSVQAPKIRASYPKKTTQSVIQNALCLNLTNALFLENSLKLIKKGFFLSKKVPNKERLGKTKDALTKIEKHLECQKASNYKFISELIHSFGLKTCGLIDLDNHLSQGIEDIKEKLKNGGSESEERSSINKAESDFSAWKGMIGPLSDINFSDTESNLSVQSLSVEVGKRQGYEISVENFDLGLKGDGEFFAFFEFSL